MLFRPRNALTISASLKNVLSPSRLQSRNAMAISQKSSAKILALDAGGTVFAEYTGLAVKHNAINLGQGFPTLPVPEFIRNAAHTAVSSINPLHQYARSEGHTRLVHSLAKYYEPKLGRKLDPMTNIITTVGATEAIYSTIQAFVNPGDEVILMQPYYDSYPASVTMAGGKPVVVSLKPPTDRPALTSDDFKLDLKEVEAAITPRTKAIMVNNPNNPIGKVFTRQELLGILDIATRHDILVFADEVYESLVYTDSVSPMIKFATLPGAWERTITFGSVGKTLGLTGWKIGWVLGPQELVRSVWMVHQFVPYAIVTPLQEATAQALDEASTNNYFKDNLKLYEKLRDKLVHTLKSVGLTPIVPHGGYFILADTTSIPDPAQLPQSKIQSSPTLQLAAADHRGRDYRVTAIPPSAFYVPGSPQQQHVAGNMARFAFCKLEDHLESGGKNLEKYFSSKI
ncbi:hypothetical protein SmJEL517_g01450 [Synchytrium microbalum]|uniref:Aminotransferase class I/classII large domain-containing protein n=1 Tax=Synchytrium microbalum TaxID=1806994 RepID=A0A507C9V3_9FUNG|nr:uncharacterized protein SmJEL517_g01450 [Synchytrium microbalum]TPX36382.1 hypothetical protein SmJEL517_g01450 [Synchytrium microbalum]